MINKENNIEEFIKLLDEELSVRKKELLLIKEIIDSTENYFKKFILIRNTIPALYANYEGFLKFSFKELIIKIKNMDVMNDKINKRFIMLSILSNLENHLSTQKAKSKILIKSFDNLYENNNKILDFANIDKYVINHDTIEETFNILGINLSELTYPKENKFPKDDLSILYGRRNLIAHGDMSNQNQFTISKKKDLTDNQVKVSYKIWKESFECVIKTLDMIKDIFIEYLINEKYLEK